jgi:hypothetical protein
VPQCCLGVSCLLNRPQDRGTIMYMYMVKPAPSPSLSHTSGRGMPACVVRGWRTSRPDPPVAVTHQPPSLWTVSRAEREDRVHTSCVKISHRSSLSLVLERNIACAPPHVEPVPFWHTPWMYRYCKGSHAASSPVLVLCDSADCGSAAHNGIVFLLHSLVGQHMRPHRSLPFQAKPETGQRWQGSPGW